MMARRRRPRTPPSASRRPAVTVVRRSSDSSTTTGATRSASSAANCCAACAAVPTSPRNVRGKPTTTPTAAYWPTRSASSPKCRSLDRSRVTGAHRGSQAAVRVAAGHTDASGTKVEPEPDARFPRHRLATDWRAAPERGYQILPAASRALRQVAPLPPPRAPEGRCERLDDVAGVQPGGLTRLVHRDDELHDALDVAGQHHHRRPGREQPAAHLGGQPA